MIDLSLLEQPLVPPPARELGLVDPDLERVVALADRGQFVAAAEHAQQLFQARVYDVRLLGFYLYGAFVEQQAPGLLKMLRCVGVVLTASWPALGPSDKKERHCDVALRWLFAHILDDLRFLRRVKKDEWLAWVERWGQAAVQPTLRQVAEVIPLLDRDGAMTQASAALVTLRDLLASLPVPPPAVPAVEPAAPALAAAEAPEPATPAPAVEPGAAPSLPPSPPPSLTVPLSPPLHALLRKLAAFNRLIKNAQYQQAAIVYKDIKQIIDKFNPCVYLPSLFGEFFKNVLESSAQLVPNLDKPADFSTNMLIELYNTDLDLFVATRR
ncbi:MAG: type VI secretion system protein IglI family protein [Polyangia bacterium]